MILLPGGCDTAWIFGDIAPRLAKVARVTSLTPRGCGASGRPDSGYGVENHVADVAAFMDRFGIGRAVLGGHSLGGGKITQFSMKYPARVERLIYLDTVFGYVAPGLEEKMAPGIAGLSSKDPMGSMEKWRQTGRLWDLGAWSAGRDRDVEATFRVGASGRLERRYKAPANWRKDLERDMNAGAYAQTRIKHPALMIFAMDTDSGRIRNFPAALKRELTPLVEDTQRHRKREIAAFAANGKHVRIVKLRHTGHYCFVHRTDRVVRFMTEFLAARAVGDGAMLQ